MKRQICILGATGSIGTQALDVVLAFPDRFCVVGLTAAHNLVLLQQQILTHEPCWVYIADIDKRELLRQWVAGLPFSVLVLDTQLAVNAQLQDPDLDTVVMAMVGMAALAPTAIALQAGKTVAMASKEVLVSAGAYMMQLVSRHGGRLVPVDSEHAALQQCFAAYAGDVSQVSRMVVTASGGPFREREAGFETITPEEALQHPRWQMGPKISIDSATMMNKGLEVIEAHYLFGLSYDHISVLVHPQSLVHAMTESIDGNMIAHLGPTDMRFPIQYAMTYPERLVAPWPKLQLSALSTLSFFEPDFSRFPLLALAYACGRKGGAAPVAMNAANEVLVAWFLEKKIGFLDIFRGVATVVAEWETTSVTSLDDIVLLDQAVRQRMVAAERRYCHA